MKNIWVILFFASCNFAAAQGYQNAIIIELNQKDSILIELDTLPYTVIFKNMMHGDDLITMVYDTVDIVMQKMINDKSISSDSLHFTGEDTLLNIQFKNDISAILFTYQGRKIELRKIEKPTNNRMIHWSWIILAVLLAIGLTILITRGIKSIKQKKEAAIQKEEASKAIKEEVSGFPRQQNISKEAFKNLKEKVSKDKNLTEELKDELSKNLDNSTKGIALAAIERRSYKLFNDFYKIIKSDQKRDVKQALREGIIEDLIDKNLKKVETILNGNDVSDLNTKIEELCKIQAIENLPNYLKFNSEQNNVGFIIAFYEGLKKKIGQNDDTVVTGKMDLFKEMIQNSLNPNQPEDLYEKSGILEKGLAKYLKNKTKEATQRKLKEILQIEDFENFDQVIQGLKASLYDENAQPKTQAEELLEGVKEQLAVFSKEEGIDENKDILTILELLEGNRIELKKEKEYLDDYIKDEGDEKPVQDNAESNELEEIKKILLVPKDKSTALHIRELKQEKEKLAGICSKLNIDVQNSIGGVKAIEVLKQRDKDLNDILKEEGINTNIGIIASLKAYFDKVSELFTQLGMDGFDDKKTLAQYKQQKEEFDNIRESIGINEGKLSEAVLQYVIDTKLQQEQQKLELEKIRETIGGDEEKLSDAVLQYVKDAKLQQEQQKLELENIRETIGGDEERLSDTVQQYVENVAFKIFEPLQAESFEVASKKIGKYIEVERKIGEAKNMLNDRQNDLEVLLLCVTNIISNIPDSYEKRIKELKAESKKLSEVCKETGVLTWRVVLGAIDDLKKKEVALSELQNLIAKYGIRLDYLNDNLADLVSIKTVVGKKGDGEYVANIIKERLGVLENIENIHSEELSRKQNIYEKNINEKMVLIDRYKAVMQNLSIQDTLDRTTIDRYKTYVSFLGSVNYEAGEYGLKKYYELKNQNRSEVALEIRELSERVQYSALIKNTLAFCQGMKVHLDIFCKEISIEPELNKFEFSELEMAINRLKDMDYLIRVLGSNFASVSKVVFYQKFIVPNLYSFINKIGVLFAYSQIKKYPDVEYASFFARRTDMAKQIQGVYKEMEYFFWGEFKLIFTIPKLFVDKFEDSQYLMHSFTDVRKLSTYEQRVRTSENGIIYDLAAIGIASELLKIQEKPKVVYKQ
jgi:RNase H-fold protein (predicted Holliday junction resolvase)